MYCVCAWMNGKKQKQMTDLNPNIFNHFSWYINSPKLISNYLTPGGKFSPGKLTRKNKKM